MNVRHFVVAVSAAAILAGSSYGALADYHKKSYSKGESHSSVVSVGTVILGTPVAVTIQKQSNSAFTNQSDGGAGADAGTWGKASANASNGSSALGGLLSTFTGGGGNYDHGNSASASGGTSGSSCAGSGCAVPSDPY